MSQSINYVYKEHWVDQQHRAETAFLKKFEEGNYTMEDPLIEYNLYGINQLSAVMAFETAEPTAMVLRVRGKTPEADFYQSFPVNTKHVLPIVGLYADFENTIEVYPWQKVDKKVQHKITTPKTYGSTLVESMDTTPEHMQDKIVFMSGATSDLSIAVDYAGDVRLDFSDPMIWDCKRLPNGDFSMSSGRLMRMPYFMSGIYEFSPVGKINKEYRVPHGYHHDQAYMPNGNILALNCNLPNGTVEDYLVEIDHETGHVVKEWDFADFIKPGSNKSGSWSDEDWFHCNAVWYDENTDSITLSGRHINAMVNIDYQSGDLRWIIGDPEGWPEEYSKYFFTPVGDGEFEWQYEQHSNLITPLGDVMCFDNHHYGSNNSDNYLAPNDSYSRSVKYRIDTEKMEIEQLWQFGKERGKDWFSPYICNTIYYNEGHYLNHSGGITYTADGDASPILGAFAGLEDPGAVLKSRTVETINDEEVMELEINSNYYRANIYTLYAKEDGQRDLMLGKGQVYGTLGETPQMDYEIPAEAAGEVMAEWHEAVITDEFDMFTFESKFEKGDLVQLQLDNGEEVRKYFVNTSAGHRGAMCAGTFLSSDDRDTRTVITKEGLEGEYDVRVLVNDKVYETGVAVRA